METRFQKIQLTTSDFVQCYFKRDLPCFQFSGFEIEDNAGKGALKNLLRAVQTLADWAESECVNKSDKCKAVHNVPLPPHLANRVPLDWRNPAKGFITVKWPSVIVPRVWVAEGATMFEWGKFEAALKRAVELM